MPDPLSYRSLAADHAVEAERLLALTRSTILRVHPTGFSTHVEVAGLAQLHATLALYYRTAHGENGG